MQMSQSKSFGSGWSLERGCTKARLEEMRREEKSRLNILLLLFSVNTQLDLTNPQYILISLILGHTISDIQNPRTGMKGL